jgi:hypothetical protein
MSERVFVIPLENKARVLDYLDRQIEHLIFERIKQFRFLDRIRYIYRRQSGLPLEMPGLRVDFEDRVTTFCVTARIDAATLGELSPFDPDLPADLERIFDELMSYQVSPWASAQTVADTPLSRGDDTPRDSGHYAHPPDKRREIVLKYRQARSDGEVLNKDAWARRFGICSKTLSKYEKEFPVET